MKKYIIFVCLHPQAHDKKKRNRMTKEAFMKNLRGVDESLTKEYLSKIYDDIANNTMELEGSRGRGGKELGLLFF